jgi:RNA polymerase sigma-70 factor (TIGR02960 family)
MGIVEAVRSGDEAAFRRLAEQHERELHLHCYRMLGSLDEADDALQETLLRAWRHRGGFEGRSSLRAWLYRIATNVCLTIEAGRRARAIPESWDEVIQSPYPDRLLDELPADVASPEARYDLQESVRLAFLTAIHHLSPRQRAVLILRDVLGFSAAEVAASLDTTRASVTSALQRARAALEARPPAPAAPPTEVERELVGRFVSAWEAVDVDGLVALLAEDVVMAMPPFPEIYRGRPALREFFATVPAEGRLEEIRLVETRANRQPALAAYFRDPDDGVFRGYGVMVLDLDGAAIAAIAGFAFAELMPVFGLPTELAARR